MADVPLMNNPMTSAGDVIYGGVSGAPTRLAKGTDGQILTLASGAPSWAAPTGLGTWTAYTPTWTGSTSNPTLGSTTISGRYKLLDSKTGIVTIEIRITTGGAWNAGSGRWIFSLPSGWTSGSTRQALTAWVLDSGVGYFAGSARVGNGATTIAPVVIADSAASNRELAHNNPVTWATGDEVGISGIIELA